MVIAKDGDTESALETREKLIEQGLGLDNVVFTALISGFCREERVIEAETTLREMVKAGFKPADDISIYTMVVDGFCTKLGDSQMCYRRLRKTDANLLSVGIVGTVGTYNVLINALFKRGQIENAE
ncbi:hypothetical protein ACOSQ3_033471 [Xanthoceras sorbifolium]